MGSKVGKLGVVAMLSAAAIAVSAPTSSASYQKDWVDGCRGYWYSTSGHGYCYDAQRGSAEGYDTNYACDYETDTWHYDSLYFGYEGKYDTHDCTFNITGTRVS
ncbi:hypothetical protein [Streptomyces pristinaespiralis]|uniref:hypothetical protein n=1 Tax=Streptomyces pristinaespiralis TaxID=38300 RepID=UPI0034046E70